MNSLTKHLKKSIEIIEENKFNNDLWRLNFHLMPPIGWLNDPNGLCYFKGDYHIFFQYSPFNPNGELKFWGHYKSKDLINWEYLGVPLLPDQPFDCHGVYSGSALIENDTMYLYYTGNVKYEDEDYDYINNGRGSNTILAISDGNKIINKKCLLTNDDYPKNLTCHIRDPKVWKENDVYYMVLGARTKEDKGIILLYKSLDKINWSFLNTIESKNIFGYMWECPDLFILDNKTIVMISPQGVKEDGYKYQNIYQSGYYILTGDYKTSNYSLNEFTEIDRGFDFYAPQTFLDNKNRRILIGWLGLPDIDPYYTNKTIENGWQHALTIPRVLNIIDNKIYQQPIEELKTLRKEKLNIQNNQKYNIVCCFELLIENILKNITIVLADDTIIQFKNNLFTLKFNNNDLGCGRTSRSVEINSCNKIQIFVDYSSIEIFINDGEEVFSTRFYPKENNINLEINGNNTENTLYTLNSFSTK
ncbi:glycoside hydrolase family 32 protein [[Clostridium] colinum]|uniref:glycoside hydrolase family 32 protein n=1 Tax=[Clostridium] colinum TaxID=36835 RepID=UPI00202407C7|nr:glycoside hydrolase family 32 protein [[Clostridium] colinum]